MDYFATALPGFGPIVRQEIAERGFRLGGPTGFDGRNDVVPFSAGESSGPLKLRTTEDVFVHLASVGGHLSLRPLVRRLAAAPLDEAIAVRGRTRRGRRPSTFRVIVRVRREDRFLRTELRDALTRALIERRPFLRPRDPAALELWVLEVQSGLFFLGLRLSTSAMRARAGRLVERPGALRPSAAAALCLPAGPPRGTLLDPLCGSGTILLEARELGWQPLGGDADAAAVEAARANLGRDADIRVWDARRLPLPDAHVEAVVSNLPFGKRYSVQGEGERWATAVVAESARVAKPGAKVVFLAPEALIRRPIERSSLELEAAHQVRVLGQRAHVWQLRRP